MKKYILIFVFIVSFSFVKAIDFSCFQQLASIKPIGQTVKIISMNTSIYPFQDGKLLNFKIYKSNIAKNIDYDILGLSSNSQNSNFIKNSNGFSFDQYDKSKYIVIKPKKQLTRNTFVLNLSYEGGVANYQISKDGINRQDIKNSITEYDIDYLKIYFVVDNNSLENTNINKLNFSVKNKSELLINSKSDNDIYIYTDYNCKNDNIYKELNNLTKTDKFTIDNNTKSYQIILTGNPKYNKELDIDKYKNDFDRDNVIDTIDNCPNIYNPDQKDTNSDTIGDVCSDDDNDSIIGFMDNCPNIYNPDQKDINVNNVGDICEFDKDKDSVFDSIDNCINIANADQKDYDSDNIGDICDNCDIYNPDQKDLDTNGIGDTCDEVSKSQKIIAKTQDKDKDSILDNKDNCVNISNIDQKDSDKDNLGDVCDNCKIIQNTDQADLDKNGTGDICEDFDKDGILGYLDNCPTIANPKQEDNNNNNIGNVCEDDDGDSVIFANDNCPNVYNPNQVDTDKDKIGDVCDKKDNRYIESNRWFFIGVSILFLAIFGGIISVMYQKIGQQKNS